MPDKKEDMKAEVPETAKKQDNKKELKPVAKKEKPVKVDKKADAPKPKKEAPSAMKGKWNILKYPHLSEKSIANVEIQNKIIFIVKHGSKRADVKKAVEEMFDVKVEKVNMLTTSKGDKKAFVRLKPDYSALDIATRLGMM